jgi:hypothetical protein
MRAAAARNDARYSDAQKQDREGEPIVERVPRFEQPAG